MYIPLDKATEMFKYIVEQNLLPMIFDNQRKVLNTSDFIFKYIWPNQIHTHQKLDEANCINFSPISFLSLNIQTETKLICFMCTIFSKVKDIWFPTDQSIPIQQSQWYYWMTIYIIKKSFINI